MLIHFLYLSTIWFAISLLTTLAIGSRLRQNDIRQSLIWLISVIVIGDVIGLVFFTTFLETFFFSALAFLFGLAWIFRLRKWNAAGQITWTMTLITTGLFMVYSFLLTAFSPLNPVSFIFALCFFFLEVITLMLALAHMHESLDVVCRTRWTRRVDKLDPIPDYQPMVSLQVPAYNEPIEVVKKTLDSLAQLDYPNFEVLVVDNNTPLESTWRPLEALCNELGPRFRCLHLDRWPGYKSGALNFAVTQTDPRAEIIGIIDADYEVQSDFLKELIPAFADPQMAFVQTPQDYHDARGDVFSESTYRGYKYFFEVSMPARNERNAIIFAGTMGLIRKSVLEEIGGWDEWCITEDAEASLRILKRGYQSLYINRAFGSGLMPFDFDGLKKQRFRWCFGGIQLLKKHWEALMPWSHWVDPENKLTMAQRYYYLVGGLGWFSDVFNLLFAFFLVLGATFNLTSSPVQIRPLTNTMLVIPGTFLVLHILRFLWVLRNRLKIPLGMAFATMFNFFSLGWAVTLACIQGLVQKEGVFLRTPKSATNSKAWRAIQVTRWETAIGLICMLTGFLALLNDANWRTFSLFLLLSWQGSLYAAAPAFSLLSNRREIETSAPVTDQGKPVLEERVARWVIAGGMLLLAAFSLIMILPPPSGTPEYVRYLPFDLIQAEENVQSAGVTFPGQPTPEATIPPTLPPDGIAIATVSVESANCRIKPQGHADRVTYVFRGQELEVFAKSADAQNPWWYVKVPDHNTPCWVWSMTAKLNGDPSQLPIK